MNQSKNELQKLPLVVDLDGTFIRTDSFYELIFQGLRTQPWKLFKCLWNIRLGKAHLKKVLFEQFYVPQMQWPLTPDLYEFLEAQKTKGRRIYLASGASQELVERICQRWPLFSGGFGSRDGINLTGDNKQRTLEAFFNSKQYVYAGNSKIDLQVWSACAGAVLVNEGRKFKNQIANVEAEFGSGKTNIPAWLRLLRIHQWSKNILLFVPMITAHMALHLDNVVKSVIAFFAFSFCASSVYLINDLLDVEADRSHKKKRFRPIASGDIEMPQALLAIPLLLGLAFFLATSLGQSFLFMLAGYFVITCLYSFWIKRVAALDVLTLSGLYVIRLLAGHFPAQLEISFWFMAFSLFFFFSLGFVKRASEIWPLLSADDGKSHQLPGRGYGKSDYFFLCSVGVASGLLSVLVFTLYIQNPQILVLYRQPQWLWALSPIFLFWISRVWLLTMRGQMNDDPVVFALRDRLSYFLGLLIVLSMYMAT